MTRAEREQFDEDGYLLIRGALSPDEVEFYRNAIDEVYARHTPGEPLHLLSAVRHCSDLVGLLDHPAVFGYVWSMMGWNTHVYHSHIDVHPRVKEEKPFWWHWHQDGGRQNREIETDPRPRLSVKLAYWFSDVSQPGRGNSPSCLVVTRPTGFRGRPVAVSSGPRRTARRRCSSSPETCCSSTAASGTRVPTTIRT